MIKDKKPYNPPVNGSAPRAEQPAVAVPEQVSENPFVNMYQAVRRAILTLREHPEEPQSPPFFKTIMIDTGQFSRIVRSENLEMEIAFPAIFIRFVNVRYLVQQQRIGEGRATMRIRFMLNTLNHTDPERECDPFIVFQRLNVAIQDAKSHEPALTERCNLLYFDMPMTTNMLQAYWVDYEVWFRESSAWKYRNWVERYLVMPPFTQHTDAPQHDTAGHGHHAEPVYEQVTGFEPSVDVPDLPEEDEKEPEEEKPAEDVPNGSESGL